jgi:hypothetical protein
VRWLIGRRLFFPESGGKHGVGAFKVELVRVELFAGPVDLFGVFGMGGIGQDGQQFFIAASEFLNPMTEDGALRTDLLALVNATPDALSAKSASEETFLEPDTRASVLLAPQLLDTHDLSLAFDY